MARLEPEHFAEKNLELVYIAGTVREATLVEQVLTEAGIDYTIGPEEFKHGVLSLFFSANTGAGFFVIAGQAVHSRAVLIDGGLTRGLVDAD